MRILTVFKHISRL